MPIHMDLKRKLLVDKVVRNIFLGISIVCASIIIIIIIFIFIHGMNPFIKQYLINGSSYRVNFWQFLFGNKWFIPPNIYGVGFVIINTLYIVFLSLILAVPIAVFTALFAAKIAPKRIANAMVYVVELLASIPSIIYGLFGAGIITLMVKNISSTFGFQSAGGLSILTTVIVLALMIIPTITMLSITSIKSVRKELINGSLALGASPTQTNFKIVLVSAKSGIVSAIILGIGRALGEATAVSMVIGNSGTGPSFNLFDTSRTLTSTMLLGLKETIGMDYDIRFSVGLVLIVVILTTNFLLNLAKRKIGNII